MDFDIKKWAKSIGYTPVTDTEEELANYIGSQKYYLSCLTVSAAINQKIDMFDWLEKYNLLVPTSIVYSVAANGVIPMLKYCIEKGYDTSKCCFIAFNNDKFSMLKWLKDNGCKCDKDKYYHGYDSEYENLLQNKIQQLSVLTEYDDLKRLFISGFTQFPYVILAHHIQHGYPRDKYWLLKHCSPDSITIPLIKVIIETEDNKLLKLARSRCKKPNSKVNLMQGEI